MSKRIEFDKGVKQKLYEGVNKLSKAVVCTLGPYGRNVIIEKDGELPISTKDGVTVAKSISLEDPIENIGAEIIKQAAIKSADQAGDGTTTTTLLATNMIKLGLYYLDRGINPVEVKKGMEEASNSVLEYIASNLIEKISSTNQYEQVAIISSNNDVKVGKLIAEALNEVGKDGLVTIEESKTGETYLETVLGMQFPKGYKSPHFVTNNSNMSVTLEDCSILIYDGIISQAKDIIPLLNYISTEKKSLLIIAQDIEQEALATLIVNKVRGIVNVCAVKAPDFGDRRTLFLEDIAILTGGTLLSKDKGNKLDKMSNEFLINALGKAHNVIVSKDDTTIIEGKGNIEDIEKRVNNLKYQINNSSSSFEKEKLQERLANLVSGISIIHVGGNNEIELKELKDRVEDALFAAKAAISKGIVPGGGVTLLRAKKSIVINDNDSVSFNIGKKIVLNSLELPLIQILKNAGIESPEYICFNLESSEEDLWRGYDIDNNTYINYKTAGIIDPYKVVYSALKNSISVAGIFLTTEAVIYSNLDKKSSNKENPLSNLDMSF